MKQSKRDKKTAKKQSGRPTKNVAITGGTGTGKSTLGIEIAKKLNKNISGRVLVISFNGSGNTWDHVKEIRPDKKGLSFSSGWRKIIWFKYKYKKDVVILKEVYKYLRDCIIIFDDCKMYMRPNIDHTPFLTVVCSDHRHLGYDLFFIAHSPKQIPVDVWTYIKYAWVFKCFRKYNENEIPCENPDLVIQAQKRVNKRFEKAVSEEKKTWGIYEFVKI